MYLWHIYSWQTQIVLKTELKANFWGRTIAYKAHKSLYDSLTWMIREEEKESCIFLYLNIHKNTYAGSPCTTAPLCSSSLLEHTLSPLSPWLLWKYFHLNVFAQKTFTIESLVGCQVKNETWNMHSAEVANETSLLPTLLIGQHTENKLLQGHYFCELMGNIQKDEFRLNGQMCVGWLK